MVGGWAAVLGGIRDSASADGKFDASDGGEVELWVRRQMSVPAQPTAYDKFVHQQKSAEELAGNP